MPIKIRKIRNKDLYKVFNSETGEIHSKGSTKENAKKQKRLLNAIDNGFIPKMKGGAFEKGIPPKSRRVLDANGEALITQITVFRYPIPSAIINLLNLITFNKLFKDIPYDTLFHLGIQFILSNGKRILIEKNQTINISDIAFAFPKDTEYKKVRLLGKKISLNELIDNTRTKMGVHFSHYTAFQYNCQNFIMNLLDANGLLNESDKKFIYQDVSLILKKIDKYPWLTSAIQKATDSSAKIEEIIQGKGRDEMICCNDY
jgi:hypothetical protein